MDFNDVITWTALNVITTTLLVLSLLVIKLFTDKLKIQYDIHLDFPEYSDKKMSLNQQEERYRKFINNDYTLLVY